MTTKLNMYVEGDEATVAQFSIQIHILLEYAEKAGLIKFRCHTASDDDIVETEDVPVIERSANGRIKAMTPEIKAYIGRLHVEKGMTDWDIAHHLKIHQVTAIKVLRELGLSRPPRKMTAEEIEQVVKLYADPERPMPAYQIAKATGWSQQTICQKLQEAGVMKRMTAEELKERQRNRGRALKLVGKKP